MANSTVTLSGAYKHIASNQEKLAGWTHKYTIPYTLLVDTGLAGTTDTVTFTLESTLPADWIVARSFINVVTAFAGSGGLAIEVGTDGDPNNFITSTSVLTAGPTITGAGADPTTLAGSFAAASDVIQALFTNSSSGSPSELTAGSVDIYLQVIDTNKVG